MIKHLPLHLSISALILIVLLALFAQAPAPARKPDVAFVPTPHEVVAVMLRLTELDRKDVLYDLGCGDGRIPIAAAKEYGARAVGVDIDPQRVKEARENALKEGVGDRVRIVQADLFETDLRDATAVTLYLLPDLNLRLRPKLLQELKAGAPIVSHAFGMGDWEPEERLQVQGPDRTHTVYKWSVPARAAGTWRWQAADGPRTASYELMLLQDLQSIEGTLSIDGHVRPGTGFVTASDIDFEVYGNDLLPALRLEGKIAGKTITGRMRAQDGTEMAWSATLVEGVKSAGFRAPQGAAPTAGMSSRKGRR
jgi:SAM-dependent methyltransferase